jgi:hypothetical protein
MAVSQSHYRFGNDDGGTEATHGWHAAEDTVPAVGTIKLQVFLLRFTSQCDGTAQSNVDCQYQVRKNGGAYQNITTSSTIVRAVAATALTNGGNCTKRLSGTGTFETTGAGQTEDGISGGNANDIVANGNSECECGLQVQAADVVNGDLLEFRLTRDGGTLYDTYSVTPSFTVSDTATLTGAFLATAEQVFAGTLTSPTTLQGAFLGTAEQIFVGSVGSGISLQGVFLASAEQIFAGQLNQRLNGVFLATAEQVFAGTVTPGPTNLSGVFLASGEQVFIGNLSVVGGGGGPGALLKWVRSGARGRTPIWRRVAR